MAIFFHCICGQSLRVDESLAGGHTRCLACGRLVKAPTLARANQAIGIDAVAEFNPAAPVGAVPPIPSIELTPIQVVPPAEKVYPFAAEPPECPVDIQRKLDRERVRRAYEEAKNILAERRRQARAWDLEVHWCECLIYPAHAWSLILGLAAAWATLIGAFIVMLPNHWDAAELAPRLPIGLLVLLLLGYTCMWLHATFAGATAGEAGYIPRPKGDHLTVAVRGGARAVWCLLWGPIVPLAVAFYFWLNSGELRLMDWLILWELGILAAGYWTLAMLAVMEQGRYRQARPSAILRFVQSVGYRRVVLAAALIAIATVGQWQLMVGGLIEIHRSFAGWLMLFGYWTAQLGVIIAVLRWLGVSRYKAAKSAAK